MTGAGAEIASFLPDVLGPAIIVATPAALALAVLFGGRGVAWGAGLALAGIIGFLFWGLGLGGFTGGTGMEALAVVIWPMMWAIGAAWSGILYLIVRLLGVLPHQRRGE